MNSRLGWFYIGERRKEAQKQHAKWEGLNWVLRGT